MFETGFGWSSHCSRDKIRRQYPKRIRHLALHHSLLDRLLFPSQRLYSKQVTTHKFVYFSLFLLITKKLNNYDFKKVFSLSARRSSSVLRSCTATK